MVVLVVNDAGIGSDDNNNDGIAMLPAYLS